jgi:hypothetical protein
MPWVTIHQEDQKKKNNNNNNLTDKIQINKAKLRPALYVHTNAGKKSADKNKKKSD